MHVTLTDWIIVAASLAVCFIPALMFARRAGQSVSEFFASGQSAPWWLVGVSMVATTFSADTPNLVTDIVRDKGGVAGNWMWWAFVLTGMATVFFYARLWRRSGVLTDLEFYELRYAGKAASAVRGFRAVYLGLFFNCVIMATVNLAAAKIAGVVLGWPRTQTLVVCAVFNIVFAASSGLWGVLVIDMIQFGIAMTGAFALAWFALQQPEIGGLGGLVEKLETRMPEVLHLVPDFGNWELALMIFIIPLAVQWWSVWYPGAEPGGGSYIAQRMLASKSERDALAGTLFFNFAHYVLRPWPWILVALCSLLIYPELSSIRETFPRLDPSLLGHDIAYPAMMKFLPTGWLGLMIAGLLAAYVSTMITHLNWGTSYLVHDFYQRFLVPGASERHYVAVGRLTTVLLMVVASAMTWFIESSKEGFGLLLQVGAGTGLIYLLRWFWWRINAWTEIAAMIGSFVVSVGLFVLKKTGYGLADPWPLVVTVGATTVVWLIAAYTTEPTDRATLVRFVKLVRPPIAGWRGYHQEAGVTESADSIPRAMLGWVLGCVAVWSGLFCTGSFLFGRTGQGFILLLVFSGCSAGLVRLVGRLWAGAR
ncbi:MAG: Na+:solute symporter [Verrucomicrobiales bacterium]|nr:Na+:solute symporter [Verrucomicrobiales bacterium]